MTTNDPIIANCGLICTKCGTYIKGKCKGCHSDKPMFSSCPVKKCCATNLYKTCADCREHIDLRRCKKLNNIISKVIGFFTRSNRIGKLKRIREIGYDTFKDENR